MAYADKALKKSYHRRYNQEWQRENRDLLRKYATTYKAAHPERMLLIFARVRAVKKGIPFDLVEADIHIPATCPVLGIPLFFKEATRVRSPSPNSPSIDRINPKLGYVKENIQVISWRANSLKKDGTPEELRKIAEYVTKTQGH